MVKRVLRHPTKGRIRKHPLLSGLRVFKTETLKCCCPCVDKTLTPCFSQPAILGGTSGPELLHFVGGLGCSGLPALPAGYAYNQGCSTGGFWDDSSGLGGCQVLACWGLISRLKCWGDECDFKFALTDNNGDCPFKATNLDTWLDPITCDCDGDCGLVFGPFELDEYGVEDQCTCCPSLDPFYVGFICPTATCPSTCP